MGYIRYTWTIQAINWKISRKFKYQKALLSPLLGWFLFCICNHRSSKKLILWFCSTREKIIELSRLVFPYLQTNEKFLSLRLFKIRNYNYLEGQKLVIGLAVIGVSEQIFLSYLSTVDFHGFK